MLAVIAFGIPAWCFTGTVVDSHARPVAGAKVSLWTFWTSPRTFHTDRDGTFLYSRNVAADGTVYTTLYKIVDARGKPIPKAIVVVPWGNDAPFTLRTNAKGQFDFPIPGAWDGVYRVMDRACVPVPRARFLRGEDGRHWMDDKTTDNRGEFRVADWQPDPEGKKEFGVSVIADGYTYASLDLDATHDRQAVIPLLPERKFTARIVDERGAPLRGVKVLLDEAHGKMKDGSHFDIAGFDLPSSWVKSGKDGSFTLRHLPDDNAMLFADMLLTIDAPGRARIERKFYRLADLRQAGTIMLPRACVVQGILRPPAGGMMPDDLGLEMKLSEDSEPLSTSDRFIGVGKDGTFRFDHLPPGEATILLSTTRRRTLGWVLPAVQHLRLAPGDVKNLELTGVTGAVISGTVRDKATGKPIPSVALTIEDPGYPKGNWWMTEADGAYTLRVAPGKVRVYVSFVFVGDQRVDFDPKEGITAEVADGENKTGMDIAISIPAK